MEQVLFLCAKRKGWEWVYQIVDDALIEEQHNRLHEVIQKVHYKASSQGLVVSFLIDRNGDFGEKNTL